MVALHLVCLGIIKKFLLFWTFKPLKFKLSNLQKQVVQYFVEF